MIAAVIVFYHPDLMQAQNLLSSLNRQVDGIIAVDNTPGSCPALARLVETCAIPNSYIPLWDNKGIGAAQNVGVQASIRCGCSHVLLLDQDSKPLAGMVRELVAAESELVMAGKRVAAVGPRYVDEKTGDASCAIHRGWLRVSRRKLDASSSAPVETDNLIASGSIIRTSTFQSVGAMREDLFMDFIDTEWGLRARSRGYESHCVPGAVMMHSTGEAAINVLGKRFYLHNDVRTYYKLRNAVYLLRLSTMDWRWRIYTLRWIPYYSLGSLWASRNKLRSARLLLTAVCDGLIGRLGPLLQDRVAADIGGNARRDSLPLGEHR